MSILNRRKNFGKIESTFYSSFDFRRRLSTILCRRFFTNVHITLYILLLCAAFASWLQRHRILSVESTGHLKWYLGKRQHTYAHLGFCKFSQYTPFVHGCGRVQLTFWNRLFFIINKWSCFTNNKNMPLEPSTSYLQWLFWFWKLYLTFMFFLRFNFE